MPLSTRLLVFFVWTLCVAAAAGSRGDELTRTARPESPTRLPPRRLAPGVETTIPARVPVEETFSRHNIPELLRIDPNWDWAKDVRFQHRVWAIEFTFKPVRFIDVDVPQRDGRMRRERVWYMVYHVRNPNRQPVPFYPSFLLEDQETKQRYPARLIPVAITAIERRERPPKRLLTPDVPSGCRFVASVPAATIYARPDGTSFPASPVWGGAGRRRAERDSSGRGTRGPIRRFASRNPARLARFLHRRAHRSGEARGARTYR